MFDRVGRGEEVALRRRAGALLMTAATIALPAGVMFALATLAVQQVLAPPDPPAPMVFLDAPPEPPLSAPAAPPPMRHGTPDADAEPAPPPVAPEDPKPPRDDLSPKIAGNIGDPKGPPVGDDHGKKAGTGLGSGTGDRPGDGDGHGKIVRFEDLELKRKYDPIYPAAARSLALGDHRCVATLHISSEGVPTDVTVTGCPDVFHAETKAALMRWRFYPVRAGKTPVATVTAVGITYKLD
jgi:hypothetical protein